VHTGDRTQADLAERLFEMHWTTTYESDPSVLSLKFASQIEAARHAMLRYHWDQD
jgi:hypothetical protein